MKKVLIILSILLVTGCSDRFINLPAGKPILVVEGWLTNQNQQHAIKVSRTVGFNSQNQESYVNDAVVILEDEFFSQTLLTFSEDGLYLTPTMSGVVGRSYRTIIQLSGGDIIESNWEILRPVSAITSLTTKVFTGQDPDTGEDVDVYYPNIEANDPPEESNYYRYVGFKNGEMLNEPEQIVVLSDQFINGVSNFPNEIPEFQYDPGDLMTIELHSLSKAGFDFLELLKSQTTSLGSSSGTSPAKLIGNLTNVTNGEEEVLGFFGASSVSSSSVTVTIN